MARRTKEDALATRAALLDAAECLFQQRGVSRTSLADIAHAAGVTRGALYGHFRDKADLFNAMMDRATLPLNLGLEAIAELTGDPIAAWIAHVDHALHEIACNAQTRRVVQIAMQKVEHVEDMGAAVDRYVQLHQRNLVIDRHLFERAAALRGRALAAPADQLAHGLHALITGLIYSWLLQPDFDLQATGRSAMATFLRGAGLDAAPAPAADSAAADTNRG